MCKDLQAMAEHFFSVQIDIFSSFFCQGELRKQPKFHILLILTGKMHQNAMEWCIFRVSRHAESNTTGFEISDNKQFLYKSQFQA